MNNPWHSISVGENAPAIVTTVIENNKSCKGKYEMHKESGLIMLDRVLSSSMRYPANYGFIPQTYCGDKDPLDILVISQVDMPQMCIAQARVLGVIEMIDGGEVDDKIIAVAENDPHYKQVEELEDLPPHLIAEIKNFFEEYKKLEDKVMEVKEIYGKEKALEIVKASMKLYQETFK